MFLTRIDEAIQAGNVDLKKKGSHKVCLVRPVWKEGVLSWQVVEEKIPVNAELLFYNDVQDGSNTLIRSWQRFYAENGSFDEAAPFSGCSALFSGGTPNFEGVVKAAIYLRYSRGFMEWLGQADAEALRAIEAELPLFQVLMTQEGGSVEKGKLPKAWHSSDTKKLKGQWILPVVCTLTNGTHLVLFLNDSPDGDYDELEEEGVDVELSKKLMALLRRPACSERDVISLEYQMDSGMGRNPFGSCSVESDSELGRLRGGALASSREQMMGVLENKILYRIKVAPNPDTSVLMFLPEGDLKYSVLKDFIDEENEKRSAYMEEKKKKKSSKNDDKEALIVKTPAVMPVPRGCATIFIANIEGSQKRKCIIQQAFPSVSLAYLACLNDYVLQNHVDWSLNRYIGRCLTSQEGASSVSVYQFWTSVFTAALQRRTFNGTAIFRQFQRFCKSFSGEELIEQRAAFVYFDVAFRLLGLQHLIAAGSDPDKIQNNQTLKQELDDIVKKHEHINISLFGAMKTSPPSSPEELVGEVYSLLSQKEKDKFTGFIKLSMPCVPDKDFASFAKGGLIGILLNQLTWSVKEAGRRFSSTAGRHPSRLRGRELTNMFIKGIGLLLNMDDLKYLNQKVMPFVRSVEVESRKDSFNSGLIMGLIYIPAKNDSAQPQTNQE